MVDYCIVSESLIENVIYFHVHDHIPHLSDNAKLSLKLSESCTESSSLEGDDHLSQEKLSSYRWFKDSHFLFQKTFETLDVKQAIKHFMESSFILDNQELSTDEALDRFNNIIYTACSKSLKRVNMQDNSKRNIKPEKMV